MIGSDRGELASPVASGARPATSHAPRGTPAVSASSRRQGSRWPTSGLVFTWARLKGGLLQLGAHLGGVRWKHPVGGCPVGPRRLRSSGRDWAGCGATALARGLTDGVAAWESMDGLFRHHASRRDAAAVLCSRVVGTHHLTSYFAACMIGLEQRHWHTAPLNP